MSNLQRIGDMNSGGGMITTVPQSTVYANGILVAVDGSNGTTHPPAPEVPSHSNGAWSTANGSPTVFINGLPVNRLGDADTCGHVRIGGSSNIFVG